MSILKLVDITTLYLLLSPINRRVCRFCIVCNVALWSIVYFPQEIYKLITSNCRTIIKIHYSHSLCQESKSIFSLHTGTKMFRRKGIKRRADEMPISTHQRSVVQPPCLLSPLAADIRVMSPAGLSKGRFIPLSLGLLTFHLVYSDHKP